MAVWLLLNSWIMAFWEYMIQSQWLIDATLITEIHNIPHVVGLHSPHVVTYLFPRWLSLYTPGGYLLPPKVDYLPLPQVSVDLPTCTYLHPRLCGLHTSNVALPCSIHNHSKVNVLPTGTCISHFCISWSNSAMFKEYWDDMMVPIWPVTICHKVLI